jgi:monomeric sarcosine oxidase
MPDSIRSHVLVIGAGAFGGWSALYLLRGGAKVTLLDAWGPGNSRASSGGETRILRVTYGPNSQYVRMAVRAQELWKDNEKRWNQRLFRRTGVLWMAGENDEFEKTSLPLLRDAGVEFEQLTAIDAQKRFPQINFEGVAWAIYEKESGFLTARRNCQIVVEKFLAEGGEYRQALVAVGDIKGRELSYVELSDGTRLSADRYLFACGPWLGKLFPGVIGEMIRATRQEVFFFGVPSGDLRYSEGQMPAWDDHGPTRLYYGVPAYDGRGFKAADDTRGADFDPTNGDRTPSPEAVHNVRDHLELRFPGLKGAPLVETRVCQYEDTPDQNFIIDRHPGAENVWLLGGGSGHGYKHGPAVGELMASVVLGKKTPHPFFSLERFRR